MADLVFDTLVTEDIHIGAGRVLERGPRSNLVQHNFTFVPKDSNTNPLVYFIRKQYTIAEVNAGATILSAVPGYKYSLVDVGIIAIAGAAGTVTTVDILATQSGSSAILVAFAQANLTQSTLLKPGLTGATILADGASFVANDVNTAITIGVTGDDVDTATHFDVLLSYILTT